MDEKFKLSKIIGIGSDNCKNMSTSNTLGLVAFTNGPYISINDIKKDKQLFYICNPNNKCYTSLAFSEKGNILCAGEGKFKNCELSFFKINESSTSYETIYSFKAHKNTIERVKFFKNDMYLMSIGNEDDKTINIWSLSDKVPSVIFTSKYKLPVLSFAICDDFLILGGEKYLKLWNLDENEGKLIINKNSIDTGKLKDKIFVSSVIVKKKALILTSDCHLTEINTDSKTISRYMHLKSSKGIVLSHYDSNIVCGCSDGVVRIFDSVELKHLLTLQRPPPLGKANIDSSNKKININTFQDEVFSDVIALEYNTFYDKLICLYSDKTYFVWDVKEVNSKASVYKFNTYPCGGINKFDLKVDYKEGFVKLIICCDNYSMQYWNFKLEDFFDEDIEALLNKNLNFYKDSNEVLTFLGISLEEIEGLKNVKVLMEEQKDKRKVGRIAYAKNIRRIFFTFLDLSEYIAALEEKSDLEPYDNKKIIEKYKYSESTQEKFGEELTFCKISPCQNYLAVGDSTGLLYIYSLKKDFKLLFVYQSHNCRIDVIEFYSQDLISNDDKISCFNYILSTGSQDAIIHIYNFQKAIENNFNLKFMTNSFCELSLSDHRAPIVGIKFFKNSFLGNSTFNNSSFGLDEGKNYFISSSSDNRINLYTFTDFTFTLLQSLSSSNAESLDPITTYSTALTYQNLLYQSQNEKISCFDLNKGLLEKTFEIKKGNTPIDNFLMILDKSCRLMAISCNDRYIRIRSTMDGELYCKIPVAESISSLEFMLGDKYLLASSIEGYLFIYKLNIKPKQLTLNDSSKKTLNNTRIKILEKLFSQNAHLKNNKELYGLFEKVKNEKELKLDDLKMIESLNFGLTSQLPQQEIILKDEDYIKNKEVEIEDGTKINKSTKFEKHLREIGDQNSLHKSIRNDRVSLSNTHLKKKDYSSNNNTYKHVDIYLNLNENKNLEDCPFSASKEESNNKNDEDVVFNKNFNLNFIKKDETQIENKNEINELKEEIFNNIEDLDVEDFLNNNKITYSEFPSQVVKSKELVTTMALNEIKNIISNTNNLVNKNLKDVNKNSKLKNSNEEKISYNNVESYYTENYSEVIEYSEVEENNKNLADMKKIISNVNKAVDKVSEKVNEKGNKKKSEREGRFNNFNNNYNSNNVEKKLKREISTKEIKTVATNAVNKHLEKDKVLKRLNSASQDKMKLNFGKENNFKGLFSEKESQSKISKKNSNLSIVESKVISSNKEIIEIINIPTVENIISNPIREAPSEFEETVIKGQSDKMKFSIYDNKICSSINPAESTITLFDELNTKKFSDDTVNETFMTQVIENNQQTLNHQNLINELKKIMNIQAETKDCDPIQEIELLKKYYLYFRVISSLNSSNLQETNKINLQPKLISIQNVENITIDGSQFFKNQLEYELKLKHRAELYNEIEKEIKEKFEKEIIESRILESKLKESSKTIVSNDLYIPSSNYGVISEREALLLEKFSTQLINIVSKKLN